MPNRHARPSVGFALLVLLTLLLVPGRDASARLEGKVWRQVQTDAEKLFAKPGRYEPKARVIEKLVEDGEKRAWKLLVTALDKETGHWTGWMKAIVEKEAQIDEIQKKPMAKRYPEEQRNLGKWKEELGKLEEDARGERGIVDDLTKRIADGPGPLRKYLFAAAKSGGSWSLRAAAASVAAVHPGEKLSFEYLSRTLNTDKDARVRMAGLEALRRHPSTSKDGEGENEGEGPKEGDDPEEGDPNDAPDFLDAAEGMIIGRLADSDWGVQLLAVQVVKERQMTGAIPHLISALGFASPRVVEAIGGILRDFTGENFDPYADVWVKWWEEHKEKFQSEERVKAGKNDRPPSDAHFYGLKVESDRILFVIDASSSMKLPTKNENPKDKWKPQGPATGPGAAPPPPPPEEILSGPKIDVAKHELKKALLQLPPSSMFNVVAFNSAVLRWKEGMQKATAKNKKDALTWVRTLEPKGSTYIDGALRLAFRMAGLGAVDKAYSDVNIDTIILLSDGAPTDDGYPKAALMDTEVILEHVREWNKHKRIVIHCVGVDIVTSIEFLQKLAEENGGAYVDR